MTRKIILCAETALIVTVQTCGLALTILGSWSASAQTIAKSNSSNSIAVKDFMSALPPSDDMRGNASYNTERTHPYQADPAIYRIYNQKNGKAKQVLLQQAQAAFITECNAKGSVIAPRESQDYALTVEHLQPYVPQANILICVGPDRIGLAMLITLKRSVDKDYPNAFELILGNAPYYLISLQPPSSIYTQQRLDREAAELVSAQRRQAEARNRAYEQELREVQHWRTTIRPGAETGCGPVLRVNGDLIEVVHYRTREPKWYRRNELWPTEYSKDRSPTCRN